MRGIRTPITVAANGTRGSRRSRLAEWIDFVLNICALLSNFVMYGGCAEALENRWNPAKGSKALRSDRPGFARLP
jgi:hypothetical protein